MITYDNISDFTSYMMNIITYKYIVNIKKDKHIVITNYINYMYIYIYSRSSVTQHADNSTLPITQHPKNIWLDSYLLHVNKNHITQQI